MLLSTCHSARKVEKFCRKWFFIYNSNLHIFHEKTYLVFIYLPNQSSPSPKKVTPFLDISWWKSDMNLQFPPEAEIKCLDSLATLLFVFSWTATNFSSFLHRILENLRSFSNLKRSKLVQVIFMTPSQNRLGAIWTATSGHPWHYWPYFTLIEQG